MVGPHGSGRPPGWPRPMRQDAPPRRQQPAAIAAHPCWPLQASVRSALAGERLVGSSAPTRSPDVLRPEPAVRNQREARLGARRADRARRERPDRGRSRRRPRSDRGRRSRRRRPPRPGRAPLHRPAIPCNIRRRRPPAPATRAGADDCARSGRRRSLSSSIQRSRRRWAQASIASRDCPSHGRAQVMLSRRTAFGIAESAATPPPRSAWSRKVARAAPMVGQKDGVRTRAQAPSRRGGA